MNNKFIKSLCITLTVVLCISSIGFYSYALDDDTNSEAASETKATRNTTEVNPSGEKDETVYVLTEADGSVKKVIVSDWINDTYNNNTLTDTSSPSNVERELPVDLTVSYKLDGKSISADDIVGKSGKVTIRFDYNNKQYESVSVNGKTEKIYVPFAMLSGMIMDNNTFSNIEVTNGKLINDGDRTAVIGIAFPKLRENLDLNANTVDIPDYVEVTADAENFNLDMTVTVATNEIFNEMNTSKLDSADQLVKSMDKLESSMTELINGSSSLYNGLYTLLCKSDELVTGVNSLTDGAGKLKDGVTAIDDGAKSLLVGATELSTGLNTLSQNSATLNSGAKQVFETLLATADKQISAAGIKCPKLTIENYAEVLNGIIASLDDTAVYNQALNEVTAAVESNRSQIEKQVTAAVNSQIEVQATAAVREQVKAQVINAATGMTYEEYNNAVTAGTISADIQNNIEKMTDSQMESNTVRTTIAANVKDTMGSEEVKQTIAKNIELQISKAISDNMASDAVQSKLTAASEGAQAIISLKASLDSYNTFYLGLISYTAGVDDAARGCKQLVSGATDLKDGTANLASGTETLYNGISQIKDGTPALTDGVSQLKDGSMQLSDGLKKFNDEGISKLTQLVKGDVNGIAARLRATVNVSRHYRSFVSMGNAADSQVKFIYRTDEISSK